jgi:Domain of unknown function DUF11
MRATARSLRRTATAVVLGTSVAAGLSVAPLAAAVTPAIPASCANVPAIAPGVPTAGTIVKTFAISGPAQTILPDATTGPKGGYNFGLSLTDDPGLKVWDIDLKVKIQHPDVDANDVQLAFFEQNPVERFAGRAVVLSEGAVAGLTTDRTTLFNDLTFDDQAPGATPLDAPITDLLAAPAGSPVSVVPEEALGGFRGVNAKGLWQLRVLNTGAAPFTISEIQVTMRTYAGATETAFGPYGDAGVPSLIDAGGTVSRTITPPAEASGKISDIDLVTGIEAAVADGLTATLANSVRTVTITSGNGAAGGGGGVVSTQVFNGTRWDDTARVIPEGPGGGGGGGLPVPTNGVTNYPFEIVADPAHVDQLVPEGAMSAFIGDEIADTWTLTVANDIAGAQATVNDWSLAFKTATCAPEVGVTTKFEGSGEVPSTTQLTQKVTVTNGTGSGASGVSAIITAPSAATITSAAGCLVVGRIVTCPVGIMGPMSTRTFDVMMKPTPALITGPVELKSDVELTVNEVSDDPANNFASATKLVRPSTADLSVSASGTPSSVLLGADVAYSASVKNTGPESSFGTMLDLPVPAGASVVSMPANCSNPAGVVQCAMNAVASGQTKSAEITLKLSQAGTIAVPFRARSTALGLLDPNPANNDIAVTTTVTDPNAATLVASSVVAPAPAVPAKTWPTQVRFKLSSAGRVRITVLSPGARKVVGRVVVHGLKGANVVVMSSRLKKYFGPKKPVVRVVGRRAGIGLVGAPDRTLILVQKLGGK